MQRREKAKVTSPGARKRPEGISKTRSRDEDMAKAIAQAQKEHGVASSNRSSVISTSSNRFDEDASSAFPSNIDRFSQMFDEVFEKGTYDREATRLTGTELPSDQQHGEVTTTNGHHAGEKEKRKDKDEDTEKKRADILEQRQAKLRQRKSIDVVRSIKTE